MILYMGFLSIVVTNRKFASYIVSDLNLFIYVDYAFFLLSWLVMLVDMVMNCFHGCVVRVVGMLLIYFIGFLGDI